MKQIIKFYDKVCKCGCGNRIPVKLYHRKKGRVIPHFIHGYHCRGRSYEEIHGKKNSILLRKCRSEGNRNRIIPDSMREKISASNKQRWRKNHSLLMKLRRYNLPYKYTGDGSFLIGNKNPDFINSDGEEF